jgi:hypothetical protein
MHWVHTEMGLMKYCASVELTLRVATDDVGRDVRWFWINERNEPERKRKQTHNQGAQKLF